MKIVLTGSLGSVGKPLTTMLVSQGHEITVISSDKNKEKEIIDMKAMPAIGSLHDLNFLTKTFNKADAVHCMIPPAYNFDASIKPMEFYKGIGINYRKAIEVSGVKRVTHLSAHGAHLDHGTGLILGSYYVEQILNDLKDVHVTHVRPTYFYYNLLGSMSAIKSTGNIYANYGDGIIPMVAPWDVAKAIAEEILLRGTTNNVRYVGSDERSGDEVARVLGAAIGKPGLKWVLVSDEDMKTILVKNGVLKDVAKELVELWQSLRTGRLTEEYHKHKPELGDIKLEDYAQEFAVAYRNQ